MTTPYQPFQRPKSQIFVFVSGPASAIKRLPGKANPFLMDDPTPTSFSPPSVEELGKLLDAYEFKAFIAQGGMGAVYHARQRSLDREVAIKILPRELGADPGFYRSFETEARAMAKLNHPNLIGVYDSGSVDGMLFIAMELVAGESLYHKYYHQRVEPSEVIRLIKAICAGLAHAHEADVIHRDIKPANIILTAKGEPKIGDFGLAQASGTGDGSGIAMGTPGYTAPEVIANPNSADRRSDLFAVGVILYELLTGQLPENPAKMPSTLTGCDPVFDKIYRRATHPSPTFRYPSAGAFSEALDEAAAARAARPIFSGLSTPGAPAASPALKRSAPATPAPMAKRPAGPATPPLAKRTLAPEAAPLATPEGPSSAAEGIDPRLHPAVGDESAGAKSPRQPSSAATPKVKISGGGLVRNILIIIALCIGIYYALGLYKEKAANQLTQKEDFEREKKAKLEAQLEAEKRRIEDARAAAQAPVTGPGSIREPVPELPSGPGTETAMDSLTRLKPKLLAGEREEFPLGTFGFGEHKFFFVPTELPWREARQFAEDHGGHLAILPTTMALELTSSKLPDEATVWIGAGISGRGQWSWLDGAAVTRASGVGSFAAMSKAGNLVLSYPSSKKFPFLIQWRTQGTNGAALEESLERAAASFKTDKPVFPTGTDACENRYFLLVQRSLTWTEADALAKKAGGHLAVITSPNVRAWVEAHLDSELPADGVAWLGGRRSGEIWSWTTREPWSPPKWSTEPAANATALAINARGQWLASDPDQKVSAFLIEWSQSSPAAQTTGTGAAAQALPAEFKVRKNQAAAAYRGFVEARDKALGENIKSFRTSIDSWQRNLVHSSQNDHKELYAKLLATLAGATRIGDTSKIKDPPTKVAALLATHLDEQKQIDLEFTKKIMGLREKYLEVLTNGAASAQNSGQSGAAAAIRAEMAASGSDFSAFTRYLSEAN